MRRKTHSESRQVSFLFTRDCSHTTVTLVTLVYFSGHINTFIASTSVFVFSAVCSWYNLFAKYVLMFEDVLLLPLKSSAVTFILKLVMT